MVQKMIRLTYARVAELVDALDLGSSSGDRVGVQVSPLAPFHWKQAVVIPASINALKHQYKKSIVLLIVSNVVNMN